MVVLSSKIGKRYTTSSNSECSNCNNYVFKLIQYDGKKTVSLCELCNIIAKYNTDSLNKAILVSSKVSQKEIIKKTFEYISKNKKVPTIKEIDPKANYIRESSIDIINAFKNCSLDERKILSNIKLFFTDKIDYNNFGFNIYTWRATVYKDYCFFLEENNNLPFTELTDEQRKIIKLYNPSEKLEFTGFDNLVKEKLSLYNP